MLRYGWILPSYRRGRGDCHRTTTAQDAAGGPVTFTRTSFRSSENCQSCHRPGQIAPMSLLTYEQVRPWARAIKLRVVAREMPPWFADPQHGSFANDRSLAQTDIDTIAKWLTPARRRASRRTPRLPSSGPRTAGR